MSTSARSPPTSSEDEGEGPETPKSLAVVPVIHLPHRWDDSGNLVPGTSPSECPHCQWDGEPDTFFGGFPFLEVIRDWTQGPFKCAWCELLRCILLKRAELEGRLVTNTSVISRSWDHHVMAGLNEQEADLIRLSIFVSSDTPRSAIDRYDVMRRFMSSDDSLCARSTKWAEDRLIECENSHQLCRSQRGYSFVPTRLINLQPGWDGPDVRLEDGDSVPSGSRYIALSYCWGNHRPDCITNAETLAQNKSRIQWDKMPLTFQDAAAFARSLGIQYLWIDSICIIQEDEEDWQREAAKMHAVYKSSYLTLVALAGSDSTSGLRSTSVQKQSTILAELRIGQTNYPLYMRRIHYLDKVAQDNINSWSGPSSGGGPRYPLISRAWAYQERTVSVRVIFFTESEMIFQCLDNADCECGATRDWCQGTAAKLRKTEIFQKTRTNTSILFPMEANNGEGGSMRSMRIPSRVLSGLSTKAQHLLPARVGGDTKVKRRTRAQQAASTWRHKVVPEYSKLEITMPRDRLPAIGAIAEQFQRVRKGETYLAGLWSGSLLDDLLWISGDHPQRPSKIKDSLKRPFSLPTWSWASLHTSIAYHSEGISVAKAKVIEASCSYVGGRAFGVLESSKLILRGRVLNSQIRFRNSNGFTLYFHDGDAWKEYSNTIAGIPWNLSFDMDQDQDGFQNLPPQQDIDILEISTLTGDPSYNPKWHFLLLRRNHPDGNVYTRAGTATFFGGENRAKRQRAGKLPQDGFESVFESRSVLTTCEIR